MKRLLAALLLLAATGARALPADALADAPGLSQRSEATYRFFGLKVYDISLWTRGRPYVPAEAFALRLTYHMNFSGRDIADRSIDEMKGQGHADAMRLARWREAMARVFPDVKPGDSLTGVLLPGREVRFYNREKFIGAIADTEFARAFFDIWLGEKTSAPALRARLLAER